MDGYATEILRNYALQFLPQAPTEALVGMAQAALMQGKREEAKVYARRAVGLGARLPKDLAEELGVPLQ